MIGKEGGFESTKLRYADVDVSNNPTCGNYTGVEFNQATMVCTKSNSNGNLILYYYNFTYN